MTHEIRDATERRVESRRRLLRRVGALGAACLTLPALAGCQILAATADERYRVRMNRNRRFEPASITVPVGAMVVWENMSELRHAVTTDSERLDNGAEIVLPDNVVPFTSPDLFTGETWVLRFTEPGSYVYACPYHHDNGMIGMVLVEE